MFYERIYNSYTIKEQKKLHEFMLNLAKDFYKKYNLSIKETLRIHKNNEEVFDKELNIRNDLNPSNYERLIKRITGTSDILFFQNDNKEFEYRIFLDASNGYYDFKEKIENQERNPFQYKLFNRAS